VKAAHTIALLSLPWTGTTAVNVLLQSLQLAYRNVTRNRRRSVLAASAVFFGVFALLTIRGVLNGVQLAQRLAMVERYTGALQVHKKGYMAQVLGSPMRFAFVADEALLARLSAVPHVTGVTRRLVFGGMLNANDTNAMALITAFDPDAEFKVCPRRREDVSTGSTLSAQEPNGLLPAAALVRRLNWKPGQPAALLTNDVDGVFNALDVTLRGTSGLPNVPGVEARTMMMTLAAAQQLLRTDNRVTELALGLDDQKHLRAVEAAVRVAVGPDYEVHTWEDLAPQLLQEEHNQEIIFGVFVGIFILAALLGITNTMLVNMLERIREIGTMLAIGARRKRILTLFILEGLLLALLGCFAGMAVALSLVAWLHHVGIHLKFIGGGILHIYPFTNPLQAGALTVLCGVGAVVASYFPASRASRMSPVRALMGNEG